MHAEFQVAIEDQISWVISDKVPNRMPKVHGIFSVSVDDVTLRDSMAKIYPVRGLLMDKVPGRPVATLRHAKVSNEVAEDLARQLVTFQMQLRRCNLQFYDRNAYNVLFHQDQHDTSITFVDYGAVAVIASDRSDTSLKRVKLPAASTSVQLFQGYYYTFFTSEVEHEVVSNLLEKLMNQPDDLSVRVEGVVSRCFTPSSLEPKDCYVWHTIMLHIMHSYDETLSTANASSLLQSVYLARRVMMTEISENSPELCWVRAIRCLVCATEGDLQHALLTMENLLDALDQERDEDRHWGLPLEIVSTFSRRPDDSRPQLMFPCPIQALSEDV